MSTRTMEQAELETFNSCAKYLLDLGDMDAANRVLGLLGVWLKGITTIKNPVFRGSHGQ